LTIEDEERLERSIIRPGSADTPDEHPSTRQPPPNDGG